MKKPVIGVVFLILAIAGLIEWWGYRKISGRDPRSVTLSDLQGDWIGAWSWNSKEYSLMNIKNDNVYFKHFPEGNLDYINRIPNPIDSQAAFFKLGPWGGRDEMCFSCFLDNGNGAMVPLWVRFEGNEITLDYAEDDDRVVKFKKAHK